MYDLLNKDCELYNTEKKVKIVQRSAKKGIHLDESDVNLLEMGDVLDDDDSSFDGVDAFEIKLQNMEEDQLRQKDNTILEERDEYMMSSPKQAQESEEKKKKPSPILKHLAIPALAKNDLSYTFGMEQASPLSIHSSGKKKLKRDDSNASIISDIVKKKKITFLKSASLFAEEDEIFNHAEEPPQVVNGMHRKLIRRNLDEKKKLESVIEKMQIGGDKVILDTISKQIQFSKEKEFIEKLLISNKQQPVLRVRQLKAMQESHDNAMAMLIEKVLSDSETRERLLDHSVLNDFYFEEKLKERRLQVLQEQRAAMKKKGSVKEEQINYSLATEVLDSLQHLPEVIRPEHIRVNIHSSERSQLMATKDKDNLYHRNIVKSNAIRVYITYRGDPSELEFEQVEDKARVEPADNKLHLALHVIRVRVPIVSDIFVSAELAALVRVRVFADGQVRGVDKLLEVDLVHEVAAQSLQAALHRHGGPGEGVLRGGAEQGACGDELRGLRRRPALAVAQDGPHHRQRERVAERAARERRPALQPLPPEHHQALLPLAVIVFDSICYSKQKDVEKLYTN